MLTYDHLTSFPPKVTFMNSDPPWRHWGQLVCNKIAMDQKDCNQIIFVQKDQSDISEGK